MDVLIVEDESRIAKRVERMTRDILGSKLHSITRIETLEKASKYLENHVLDLVLLDLNLNGANGFDLLSRAVASSFHTIIISAYKEQAITAFEYGVLDFVPKPFNRDRLEQAFDKIFEENAAPTKTKYLAVKKRGSIHLIPIEDILYIKGAGPYTELFLDNGRKELHDKSLEKLELLLSPSFERIHKSYLVKMSEVDEIVVESGSKYMARLKHGELIPIGRTRYKRLKERWF